MKVKKQIIPESEKQSVPKVNTEEEEDKYAGYTREDPPPWLDEVEYIDSMMTH